MYTDYASCFKKFRMSRGVGERDIQCSVYLILHPRGIFVCVIYCEKASIMAIPQGPPITGSEAHAQHLDIKISPINFNRGYPASLLALEHGSIN